MNAGTNPIRSYSSINGVTACMTPIQTDMPQWVIQTAEKWGLYWGGYGWNAGCPSTSTQRTVVSRDPPHFEFRGTPRQAAAIAAFNLRNDPNVVCRDDRRRRRTQRSSSARCRALPGAGIRLPVHLDPPDGRRGGADQPHRHRGHGAGLPDARGLRAALRAATTSALTYAAGQSVAAMAIVPITPDGHVLRVPLVGSPQHRRRRRLPRRRRASGCGIEPSTPTRLTDTRVVGVCEPGLACRPGPLPAFTKQRRADRRRRRPRSST